MSHTTAETLPPPPKSPFFLHPKALAARFTPETATRMANLSVAARKRKKEVADMAAAASLSSSATPDDPYVFELAQAQAEVLKRLRSAQDPKDKAYLAKALRDLRETWHMVTGTPKPGMIKPGGVARPMPRPLAAPTPSPVPAQEATPTPALPQP